MTEKEKADIGARVKAWARARPVLEEERRNAIINADTSRFVALCDGLLKLAAAPSKEDSGLVEQQHVFRKLRR